MSREYYAHTLEGKPSSDWQPLEEHVKKVVVSFLEIFEPFKNFREWREYYE